MKKLFTILFVLLSFQFYGQSDSSIVNKYTIKISPLSFHVPYVGRSARLGFEYRVKPFFTIEHELGFFFDNSKGLVARTDLKWYLKNWNDGTYVSMDLFYKQQNYNTGDSIGNSLYEYRVEKNVGAVSFKFGKITTFKFGLVLDFHCGLGIRLQQNRNDLPDHINSNMPPTTDYGPNLILNKAGNRAYPNLYFGFKVGYRFK